MISEGALTSVVIWGPPGTGKTTVAWVLSNATSARVERLSAVTSGVADLRKAIDVAGKELEQSGLKTLLLIDEIHRFNKSQQDALLPAMEDGRIVLIGTTTENPYFEVNSALLSRARVVRLEALSDADLAHIVRNALADNENGLGDLGLTVDDVATSHLIRVSKGDARVALSILEASAEAASAAGQKSITLETVERSSRVPAVHYDKDGDVHYDIISAFIKSMRGSDPDSALYWLARMIEGGEDPRFIARRLIIFSSEDVGLADSSALSVAVAASQAVDHVGLPEARINLAHATTYMALAPKSNSAYKGIKLAQKSVTEHRDWDVPVHLKDASYPGARKLGHGKGYKYPHDGRSHWVAQEYMPKGVKGAPFYRPGTEGEERALYKQFRDRTSKSPATKGDTS